MDSNLCLSLTRRVGVRSKFAIFIRRLLGSSKRDSSNSQICATDAMPLSDKLRDKVVFEPFSAKFRKEATQLLLTTFKNDEPMNAAMETRMTDAQAEPVFERLFVEPGIKDGSSIVAVDKTTGRLIGVYISSIHRRSSAAESYQLTDANNPMVIIMDFLDIVGSGIWDMLPPDVNAFVKNDIASVLEEYRSLKLAGTMKEMSIEAAKRQGCQYAVAIATARQSQRMNERLGFEMLRFINYDDYRVLGQRPFVNMKPPHVRAQLMVKRLV